MLQSDVRDSMNHLAKSLPTLVMIMNICFILCILCQIYFRQDSFPSYPDIDCGLILHILQGFRGKELSVQYNTLTNVFLHTI